MIILRYRRSKVPSCALLYYFTVSMTPLTPHVCPRPISQSVKQILPVSFFQGGGHLPTHSISEGRGPNCTKSGEDTLQSLLLKLSDILLRFETRTAEGQVGLKIEAKFRPFCPPPLKMRGRKYLNKKSSSARDESAVYVSVVAEIRPGLYCGLKFCMFLFIYQKWRIKMNIKISDK